MNILYYSLPTLHHRIPADVLGSWSNFAHQKQWLPFAIIAQIVGTDIKLIHTA